jgi:DNA polymerase-3 subunit delta'
MALKDVIGHEKALHILFRTIQKNRIPSAYLFAGESGIGKRFAALNLTKALNCEESTVDACDTCLSCHKIEKGIHPDILLILPENNKIKIDEIRAIDQFLSLKAFEGRKKVIIVDDAETMNQYAANAFLKTLEEPPEDSLIILISSNPERLPGTIRSRCHKIPFTPLSSVACEEVIRSVLSEEKTEAGIKKPKTGKPKTRKSDSEHIALLMRLSLGRPGVALADDLVEERAWFLKVFKEILGTAKDSWASRDEMEKWFEYLLILLRDIALCKVTTDQTHVINRDIQAVMNALCPEQDLKSVVENFLRLHTFKKYFQFNINKSLSWNFTSCLLRERMGMRYA